jgi:hypothetical protein
MQFECQNIKAIIDSNFDIRFDEEQFLNHIESCPDCRALVELKPEVEERLANLLVHPAPVLFTDEVLKTIRAGKTVSSLETIFKTIQWAASGIALGIAIVMTILNRGVIASAFDAIRNQSVTHEIISFIQPLGILKDKIGGELSLIVNSPLILAALTATVVLIWSYCILKFRETMK